MEQNEDILMRVKNIENRVAAIYESTEKTRKYLLWTMIGSLVMFVLPLVALVIFLPMFLSDYMSAINGI